MPYKPFEPKDSLEAVMSKLWGDPREVNPKTRLEELILKIADAQPTGQSIPAPSNPSDGDVLTYDSTTSAWVAEAPSGGGGNIFTVGITLNQDEQYVTDKTASEILTAYTSGYFIYLQESSTGEDCAQYNIMYVSGFTFDNEQEEYKYVMVTTNSIEFSASSGNSTMTEVTT